MSLLCISNNSNNKIQVPFVRYPDQGFVKEHLISGLLH